MNKPPIWLLGLITISGTLAMHMFVPALPSAAQGLGASTAALQMTISIYILGLAVGQLLYGPFSDAFGRRPTLLFGLFLYALAGLVAAMAPNVHTLVVARLFQALGGCSGMALGRAIVRDSGNAEEAMRDLALLNLLIVAGPGLAPMIGAGVNSVFGWRAIFVLLTVAGCFTLFLTWRMLPETGRPCGKINAGTLVSDYVRLCHLRPYLGFALAGGCATTSMYAFIASAPFIVTVQLHRSMHEVGFYLAFVVAGAAVGNAITRQLSRKVSAERLLLAGNALAVLSVLGFLLVVLLDQMAVWNVMGLMFLYAIGGGVVGPTAMSKALAAAPDELVGSAAGLYGFLQMGVGAVSISALGIFSNPATAAASVLMVIMLLGMAVIRLAIAAQSPDFFNRRRLS